MKIGIISDTHDNLLMINRAVQAFKEENIGMLFHAGDHIAPFTPMIWKKLEIEVQAIFGNNDGDRENLKKSFLRIGDIHERPKEFIIYNKKIIMLHEPDNLDEIVKSEKYDYVIYGHTHRKKAYHEGRTFVINPGEGCGWITGEATAVTLDLETGEYKEIFLGNSPIEPLSPA